jgi:hypothetical protein
LFRIRGGLSALRQSRQHTGGDRQKQENHADDDEAARSARSNKYGLFPGSLLSD